MRKITLQIIVSALLLLLLGNCAVGQANPEKLGKLLNSPKMLVTNQDIFLPGEYLHFRLFGNSFNSPRKITAYLLDTDHNIKFKQEVEVKGHVITGNFRLPSYLNKSKYHLLCVDNAENIYGLKEMWITAPKEKNVNFKVTFDKEGYTQNEMVKADLHFSSDDIMGIKSGKGKYTVKSADKILHKGKFKIGNNSTAEIEFENNYEGFEYIEVEFKYAKDKYLFYQEIPNKKQQLNVTFRPEGGNIIAGVNNKVAVRILSFSNIPVEIKGNLKDNSNNEISEIKTNKSGHGVFEFVPEKNKTYHIEFSSNEVINSKIDLPALSDKAAISLGNIEESSIGFNINTNNAFEGSILALNNNKVFFNKAINISESVSESIPVNNENEGLVSIFLINKEGEIVSTRNIMFGMILAPNLTVDNSSYGTESKIEASVLDNTSLIGERTLTFNAVQKNRVSTTIPWNFYCLDYCFNPLILNQLSITEYNNLNSILKLKYSLSAYLKSPVCISDNVNKLASNSNNLIIDQLTKNNVTYNLSSIIPEIKDENLGKLSYSNNTKELLKEKEPERYQVMLSNGIPVLDVVYAIKPYTNSNGRIMFNGVKNSVNMQQGALVYIDGVKSSFGTSALENLDPTQVGEIKVITDPAQTLAYTSYATMGIIDIKLKEADTEEINEKAKEKLSGAYKANLYWNAQLPIRPKTNSKITFSSSKLQDDFIVYIFDQKPNNLPIFNVRSFEVVGNN